MKKLFICLLLISANCLAEEKLFQEYIYPYSRITSPCSKANEGSRAIPQGTSCTLLLRIPLYQRPGANLIRLAKEKHYRPIYFWVEQRIEDGQDTWKRVSGVKQYRHNDFFQEIAFTPNETAIFRIAVDYKRQKAFADTSCQEYKIVVK